MADYETCFYNFNINHSRQFTPDKKKNLYKCFAFLRDKAISMPLMLSTKQGINWYLFLYVLCVTQPWGIEPWTSYSWSECTSNWATGTAMIRYDRNFFYSFKLLTHFCSLCLYTVVFLFSECLNNTYGYNCSRPCPTNCRDECLHTDGSCICQDGWTGPLCQDGMSVH